MHFDELQVGQQVAVFIDAPDCYVDTVGTVERLESGDYLGGLALVRAEGFTEPLRCRACDLTPVPDLKEFSNGPTPGTAAYTAFIMAQLYPPDGAEIYDGFWDDFKNDLKDNRLD